MKYIVEIPDDFIAEIKKITPGKLENTFGKPMKELIECKDCKYCAEYSWDEYHVCRLTSKFILKMDGYCHRAERKE